MQNDGYNCGVIGLVHCIELYRKSYRFKDLTQEEQQRGLLRLRLNILSMIRAIYEELNGEYYDIVADHLYFYSDAGKYDNFQDLMKFEQIHKIFDAKKYIYVNDHKNDNFFNANTACMMKTNKTIQHDYYQAFPSPLPKKRSPSPKKASQFGKRRRKTKSPNKSPGMKTPTPSKPKSATKTSRSTQRKEKKQNQTGFLNSLDELNVRKKCLYNDYRHTRSCRLFDVSDTNLYLIPDDSVEDQNLVTPHDMTYKIVDLFSQCYKKNTNKEAAGNKENSFVSKVKTLMSKYKTYFVMDLITDDESETEESYQLIAAVIIEDDIELDRKEHVLIHMTGIHQDYQEYNHLSILLFNVLTELKKFHLNYVVMTSFGEHRYVFKRDQIRYSDVTPEKLFLKMNFSYGVEDQNLNAAIGEMIEPQSQIMYGKGTDIQKLTAKHSQFFDNDSYKDCRILGTHNHVKFLVRYVSPPLRSDKGHLEMWNHTFLWKRCTTRMTEYVASDRKVLMENPGKILIIKGGGNREESCDKMLLESDKKWEIDSEIVSNAQKSTNNCVWLSTLLLIQLNDKEVAKTMLTMLNNDNAAFQWMFLTKIPPSFKKMSSERHVPLLKSILQRRTIGYQLKKVNIGIFGVDYIGFLFLDSTCGQYICQLETEGGCRKHVIGVDVDRKAILDASENYALELTRENLDYCTGKQFLGIRKIIYCYELCKNR